MSTKQTNLFGMKATNEADISNYTTTSLNDLDVGYTFRGEPSLLVFDADPEKKYRTILLKLIDHPNEEVVNIYMNTPLFEGNKIRDIRKFNDFTRVLFDFIFSLNRMVDENSIYDKNGEEINKIQVINIDLVKDFLNNKEIVGIKVTEGNPDSIYPSFIINHIE